MNAIPLLGSFGNLFGPDMIIMFVLQIAFIVGIILLVVFLVRRGTSSRTTPSSEERLRKLDALRSTGSVTNVEYEEQRRRILGEM